jgi:hypothetical protein
MSMFSNILGKIFNRHPDTFQTSSASSQTTQSTQQPSTQPASTQAGGIGTSVPPMQPMEPVDVEAVLNGMAAKNSEKLNWRTSIVDLLKLLGMDSSLSARKQLAQELDYSGDAGDSAAMNIWLHKQVMKKLAENGGKLPADLTD